MAKRKAAITEAEAVRDGLRGLLADHGWAIAMHGSYVRDFDFIAVPWAGTNPTAVGALVSAIEAEFERMARGPTWKPHGRLAYAFIAKEWTTATMPRVWDISFVDPTNAIERGFAKAGGR